MLEGTWDGRKMPKMPILICDKLKGRVMWLIVASGCLRGAYLRGTRGFELDGDE
jgi:hypothetical protein